MSKKYKKYFAVDFAISFISVFGVVMFLAMLPKLQSVFHINVSEVSWIPNLGYITMILFAFLAGKFINGKSLKNLLLFSLITWVLGIFIEIISLNVGIYAVFIFGRFIEGIGEAVIFPILLSMNKIVFEDIKSQKIGSSFVELGGAAGGMVSAFISGKFIDMPNKFLLIPIAIAFLDMIFILVSVDNVVLKQDEENDKVENNISESNITYVSLLITILIIQITFSSTQVYLAYYMKAVNGGGYTSSILVGEEIFTCIGSVIPTFLSKKVSFKTIRNAIFCVFIVSTVIVGFQVSIFLSVIFFMIINLFVGIGFTILNVYVSKVIKTRTSMKLSIYMSVRNSGGFILSLIWGEIIQILMESGNNYNVIFKKLYISECIIAAVFFIIIIFLQKNQSKDLDMIQEN